MFVTRKWTLSAGALLAAIAIGLALAPWALDADGVARRLTASFLSPAGYRLERPAAAEIRFLPAPVLDIFGVRVTDSAGRPAFTASTIAFRLSLIDLIAGRYAPIGARVKDPAADIDLDAMAAALPRLIGSTSLTSLQFRGGRFRLQSRRNALDETLEPASGLIAFHGLKAPVAMNLTGDWRGERTELAARIASPSDLLVGRTSEAEIKLESAGALFDLDGTASIGAAPQFHGRIRIAAASFARLAKWSGLPVEAVPDGSGAAEGMALLSPSQISFEDGELSFGDQKFDGGVDLRKISGEWVASATLAADRVDFGAFFGLPLQWRADAGGWSVAPVAPAWPPVDLDIRLSTATALWGGMDFSDVAVAITKRGAETHVRALQGAYAGGAITGDVIVKDCPAHCSLRATFSVVNANLTAAEPVLGRHAANGVCTIDVDVSASGNDPASWFETMEGDIGLTVRDGAVTGVNFEEALRRSQRRAVEPDRDLLIGQTPFRKLEARLVIDKGVARFSGARMTGPGVFVTSDGAIDFARQTTAMSMDARQADGLGHVSPNGASMTLRMNGDWNAPDYTTAIPAAPDR